MNGNGTVLVAGADTRHGGVYARAFAAGDYRVRALVAEATSERPEGAARRDASPASGRAPSWGEDDSLMVDLADGKAVRRAVRDAAALVIALDGRGSEGRTGEERATRTLLEAAASEGVTVLYSSLLHADRQTGVPSLDLKGRLELVALRSGGPVTVLRPALLMETFDDAAVRRQVTGDGVLASAIGVDVPVSYLAADDLAILAVFALEDVGWRASAIDLGGPHAVTFRELLPQLWRMTGHSVTYEQRRPGEVVQGSGDDEARLVRHINDEGYAVDMRPVLERLPVRLTTLGDHLSARGWAAEGWAAASAARAAA